MTASRVEFTLKCRVLDCREHTDVGVVFSNADGSDYQTGSLLPGEGWRVIFRERDDHTLLAAVLCPVHR